jgi:toxin-antitoxin system PIN domain toxin
VKLPDVNLLVAASYQDHEHHAAAAAWLKRNPGFATCPVTELGLVRVLMQLGASPEDAFNRLAEFIGDNRRQLVPADVSASAIAGRVTGHRQTTDEYLAALAAEHRLTLATFDQTLAKRHKADVELVS